MTNWGERDSTRSIKSFSVDPVSALIKRDENKLERRMHVVSDIDAVAEREPKRSKSRSE